MFFEVFGQEAGLEPKWRAWFGNAVRESRSACRSSKSARLGFDDLAKLITRFPFHSVSRFGCMLVCLGSLYA